MKFYSPLRYPGGKSKLVPLLKMLISKAHREGATYIEPFAGGAGVALALLMEGVVSQIVINDYDMAVSSFWMAIKNEPFRLIELIDNTPITINEWFRQRDIYQNARGYDVEFAFATLFLNRVNRSGIITGGPIGGYKQDGNWKLDARYNKKTIINRILDVSRHKNAITVHNQDIIRFVDLVLPKYAENAFVYFDPPYYYKSKKLYKNALSIDDHAHIAEKILERVKCPWVLTYDDVPEIRTLYREKEIRNIDLNYSVANKGKVSEIVVCSSSDLYPTISEMRAGKIFLNMRQIEAV